MSRAQQLWTLRGFCSSLFHAEACIVLLSCNLEKKSKGLMYKKRSFITLTGQCAAPFLVQSEVSVLEAKSFLAGARKNPHLSQPRSLESGIHFLDMVQSMEESVYFSIRA